MSPIRWFGKKPSHRLLFLHIPKTAGTSLRFAIRDLYKGDEALWVYPSMDWAVHMRKIGDTSEERRERARMVFGHMPYGVHEHFDGPWTYAAVLRDPVERVKSLFMHMVRSKNRKQKTGGQLNPMEAAIESGELGLREFVLGHGPAERHQNQMTNLLAGVPQGVDPHDPRLLDMALENVERHFIGVGLTENVQDFVDVLGPEVGWGSRVRVGRKNAIRHRPEVADPDDEVVALIQEHLALDIELVARISEMTAGGSRLIGGSGP